MNDNKKTLLDDKVFDTASKLSQMKQGKTWGKLFAGPGPLTGLPMIRRRDIIMCLQYTGELAESKGKGREGMQVTESIQRLYAQGRVERVQQGRKVFVVVK
jgi:hypothetical protein